METKQLKNIAILILLLLNGFLLLLLGYQELQGRRVSVEAMRELEMLFASEDLELSLPAGSLHEPLAALTLVRQTETERAIAEFLLGEAANEERMGGGIYSYSNAKGAVQFRSGGGFDTVSFARDVDDISAFVLRFCEEFDYRDIEINIANGEGIAIATQYLANEPVFGSTVTLHFSRDCLVSVVGAYVDLKDAVVEGKECMNGASVLVRFLDHRREAGIVCSKVSNIRCVYQLSNTSAPARLLPVWEIETDTYTYLVDGISAAVSRK